MKSHYRTINIIFAIFFSLSLMQEAKGNIAIQYIGFRYNGEVIDYPLFCGDLVPIKTGDIFQVYVRAYSSDPYRIVTLSATLSPATSMASFYPELPVYSPPGAFVQTQFTFAPIVLYAGDVRFKATDGLDSIFCDLLLDFIWPVEISVFNFVVYENNITIKWTTTSELNNARFEIERADNVKGQPQIWSMVGSKVGNGTSTLPLNYTYTDRGVNSGTYSYRLKQIDMNGNFEYHYLTGEVIIGIPVKFELSQNYPNPFNPSTKIDFQLPKDGNVTLSVYDNTGKMVSNISDGFRSAGYYSVDFNASGLSSGIYFYRLQAGDFSKVLKLSLIK